MSEPNIIAITVKSRPELMGMSLDRDPSPQWTAGRVVHMMELKPGEVPTAQQLLKLLYETRRDYGPASTVELRLITEEESDAPYWKAFGDWVQARREEEAQQP